MVDIDFEFIASTVPAIIVLGGILLLFFGYVMNVGNIGAGWGLVIFGGFLFFLEVVFSKGKGRSK
jgi:membrane-bound ClpP family serine protease